MDISAKGACPVHLKFGPTNCEKNGRYKSQVEHKSPLRLIDHNICEERSQNANADDQLVEAA